MLRRGTMWRVECEAPIALLLIEATNSHYQLPDKGMIGEHAIFDPAMLDYPRLDDAFRAQALRPGAWRVQIKRRQQISTVTYPYNPLDAVDWHGSLMPVRINVQDIRPLMSHPHHLPPSAPTPSVPPPFALSPF